MKPYQRLCTISNFLSPEWRCGKGKLGSRYRCQVGQALAGQAGSGLFLVGPSRLARPIGLPGPGLATIRIWPGLGQWPIGPDRPYSVRPNQHMLKKIEPKGPHLFFIWQVLSQQIKSLALYCTTYTKESTHPLWALCCSIIQQKALPDLLNIHAAQVRWPNQSLVGQGEGMLYVNFSSSELVSSPQEGRNVAKRMRPQEGMLWL